MIRDLFDFDLCKVMLAGIAGISTTLTDLDLAIKCLGSAHGKARRGPK